MVAHRAATQGYPVVSFIAGFVAGIVAVGSILLYYVREILLGIPSLNLNRGEGQGRVTAATKRAAKRAKQLAKQQAGLVQGGRRGGHIEGSSGGASAAASSASSERPLAGGPSFESVPSGYQGPMYRRMQPAEAAIDCVDNMDDQLSVGYSQIAKPTGEIAGWLWCQLRSDYRGIIPREFPPTSKGPHAKCFRRYARIVPATSEPTAHPPLLRLSEVPDGPVLQNIDLTGCVVSINLDHQFRERPKWVRKGPLELAHASRNLLLNEQSLIIYTFNGALKEQWLKALRAAIEGGPAQAIDHAVSYAKYLADAAEKNPGYYWPLGVAAQGAAPAQAAAAAAAASEASLRSLAASPVPPSTAESGVPLTSSVSLPVGKPPIGPRRGQRNPFFALGRVVVNGGRSAAGLFGRRPPPQPVPPPATEPAQSEAALGPEPADGASSGVDPAGSAEPLVTDVEALGSPVEVLPAAEEPRVRGDSTESIPGPSAVSTPSRGPVSRESSQQPRGQSPTAPARSTQTTPAEEISLRAPSEPRAKSTVSFAEPESEKEMTSVGPQRPSSEVQRERDRPMEPRGSSPHAARPATLRSAISLPPSVRTSLDAESRAEAHARDPSASNADVPGPSSEFFDDIETRWMGMHKGPKLRKGKSGALGDASQSGRAGDGFTKGKRKSAVANPPDPNGFRPAFGLNLFFARIFYDLTRNPEISTGFMNKIQVRLDRIPLPNYIGPIRVSRLGLGSSPPVFANVVAVEPRLAPDLGATSTSNPASIEHLQSIPLDPSASAGPAPSAPPSDISSWPVVEAQVRYRGNYTMTLETNLKLQETGIWGQLEKWLEALEGGSQDGSDSMVVTIKGEGGAEAEAHQAAVDDSGGPTGGPAEHQTLLRSILTFLPRIAARGARKVAGNVASKILKIQLQLSVELESLEGTLRLWIPPPPSDRLWFGFTSTPSIKLVALPLIDGQPIKNGVLARRISGFFEQRLERLIVMSLVLPACEGANLPGLTGVFDMVERPTVAVPPPAADPSVVLASGAGSRAPSPANLGGSGQEDELFGGLAGEDDIVADEVADQIMELVTPMPSQSRSKGRTLQVEGLELSGDSHSSSNGGVPLTPVVDFAPTPFAFTGPGAHVHGSERDLERKPYRFNLRDSSDSE